jgi:hypothetical protein
VIPSTGSTSSLKNHDNDENPDASHPQKNFEPCNAQAI